MTPDFPAKLRRLVARLGWGAGATYLLHRALTAATGGGADLHCYRLVLQPVRSVPILPEKWRGRIEVRALAAVDLEIGRALSRREDLGPRLARGDLCLAAFEGKRLAGHLWLCFAEFDDDETGCRFALQPGTGMAWDYDLWIAPESRGGGAFAALWDAAWAVLRQRGYGWTASRVSAFNDLSLRAHRRLGAREVATFLVLRAGGWRLAVGNLGPALRLYGRDAPSALVAVPEPPAGTAQPAGGPSRGRRHGA